MQHQSFPIELVPSTKKKKTVEKNTRKGELKVTNHKSQFTWTGKEGATPTYKQIKGHTATDLNKSHNPHDAINGCTWESYSQQLFTKQHPMFSKYRRMFLPLMRSENQWRQHATFSVPPDESNQPNAHSEISGTNMPCFSVPDEQSSRACTQESAANLAHWLQQQIAKQADQPMMDIISVYAQK
jgi:hypothetical protein